MKTSLYELGSTDQKTLKRLVKNEIEEVTAVIDPSTIPNSTYHSHLQILMRQLDKPIQGLTKEIAIQDWLDPKLANKEALLALEKIQDDIVSEGIDYPDVIKRLEIIKNALK